MSVAMQGSIPILANYLKSLVSINPTWNCEEEDRKKDQQPNTFSNLLNHEYSTTKAVEIQRSNDNEEPLFHKLSNPFSQGPLEIQFNSTYGRYLVASRDIRAGEIVFKEKPLVLAPKAGTGPTCLECLRVLGGDWEGCGECGAPLCSPPCLGKGHSPEECQVLSRLGLKKSKDITLVKIMNTLLTPLRTLLLLKENDADGEVIAALQSNKERRRKLPIGHFVENHIVKTLQIKINLDVESDIIHHICGVFDTNAFEVSLDNSRKGRALFPLGAIMNHSCLPNTQHWYKDGVLTVRAVTDIDSGESITNTYTTVILGTRGRTSHLAATKLFQCSCKRCLDPTELGSNVSSIACRGCKNGQGIMIPPDNPNDDWKCSVCDNTLSSIAVDTMIRAASTTVSRITPNDTDDLTGVLKNFRRLLGEKHYIILELKYALMCSIMQQPLKDVVDEELNTVIDISRDLLETANHIDPGYSRFRGMVLLEKLKASAEQLRRQTGSTIEEPPNVRLADEDTLIGKYTQTSSSEAKMLLSEAAECELILQYDPKFEEVLRVTHLMRGFV